MTRIIRTKSGAEYEVANNGAMIRRLAGTSGNDKRADGQWVELRGPLPATSTVGLRLRLVLEPLFSFGPDDEGHEGETESTTRVTTPVVYDSVAAS